MPVIRNKEKLAVESFHLLGSCPWIQMLFEMRNQSLCRNVLPEIVLPG
jgi:hypothetical protein